MRDNTNMKAVALQDLDFDKHRTYLAVFADGADVTVTISGGAPFTIRNGSSWGPQPAPMNDIAFNGAGTIVTG